MHIELQATGYKRPFRNDSEHNCHADLSNTPVRPRKKFRFYSFQQHLNANAFAKCFEQKKFG